MPLDISHFRLQWLKSHDATDNLESPNEDSEIVSSIRLAKTENVCSQELENPHTPLVGVSTGITNYQN